MPLLSCSRCYGQWCCGCCSCLVRPSRSPWLNEAKPIQPCADEARAVQPRAHDHGCTFTGRSRVYADGQTLLQEEDARFGSMHFCVCPTSTSIKRAQSLFVTQNLTTDRIFRTQACQEPRVKVTLGARRVWASFVVFNEGAFGALRTPSGQRDWGSCGSILPFISYLFLTRRYKGEAIKRQVAL